MIMAALAAGAPRQPACKDPGDGDADGGAYLDALSATLGHADRAAPFQSYCTGLLLPGERKSVEPMAARLAPDNVCRAHQSLHHLVADAPWSDASPTGDKDYWKNLYRLLERPCGPRRQHQQQEDSS
jgi:hypothetical protein